MSRIELFSRKFTATSGVDIGKNRDTNQDQIIFCPEYGFFAVSDGMGGLAGGGETSRMIANVLPEFIKEAYTKLERKPSLATATRLLEEMVRLISDNIYENMNKDDDLFAFGATLCGVWLIDNCAVFVNLGDSRGYYLGCYQKTVRQVTSDHNVAALLVADGQLSRDEARHHPSSCSLTRFVGMQQPALPEIFVKKLQHGDRILVCSDGLHGMLKEERIARLMRSSRTNHRVVKRLINEANAAGGLDNIAVIYIKISKFK